LGLFETEVGHASPRTVFGVAAEAQGEGGSGTDFNGVKGDLDGGGGIGIMPA